MRICNVLIISTPSPSCPVKYKAVDKLEETCIDGEGWAALASLWTKYKMKIRWSPQRQAIIGKTKSCICILRRNHWARSKTSTKLDNMPFIDSY
jgi:hypothetical protein